MDDRRLIEDYLPLDALNAIAAKEKKHPKHPVALVHYWPARRPTTASRAAIYAALVPAPRSGDERQDAASFVTGLAAFKPDPEVVEEAGDRIRKAHGGRTPKVLDLFASGGAIPLEAARLGCESHALDYNPVAHLIELCTLVYPQTFGPKLADDFEHWSGVVLERMRAEVGDLYPAVQVPATEDVTKQAELFGGGGDPPPTVGQADPVACIWVRTVPCRRPGCTAPVPLVRQAWLRRKGGVVAAVPEIEDGDRLGWRIVSGAAARDVSGQEEQTGAGQAVCVACHAPAPADHVKEMAVAGRMEESLTAIVGALPPKRPRSNRRPFQMLSLSVARLLTRIPGSTTFGPCTPPLPRCRRILRGVCGSGLPVTDVAAPDGWPTCSKERSGTKTRTRPAWNALWPGSPPQVGMDGRRQSE